MNRETAERSTILRGLVGSTVHGLAVDDGLEDRDEMGVCVEPFDAALSLGEPFEQFIYRSAAEREGRQDARSSAGDLDLTIYGLRKWIRLALKGNPTILLLPQLHCCPLWATPLIQATLSSLRSWKRCVGACPQAGLAAYRRSPRRPAQGVLMPSCASGAREPLLVPFASARRVAVNRKTLTTWPPRCAPPRTTLS